jgi:hypothetical protein
MAAYDHSTSTTAILGPSNSVNALHVASDNSRIQNYTKISGDGLSPIWWMHGRIRGIEKKDREVCHGNR